MLGTINIRTWDGRHCHQIIIRRHRVKNNMVRYQQHQESTLHMRKLEVPFEKKLLVMVIGKTGSLLRRLLNVYVLALCSMFTYWYYAWRKIKVVFLVVQSFREAIIDLHIAVIEGIDPLSLH